MADRYRGMLPSVRHEDFIRFAYENGLPEIADWFANLPNEWPEQSSVIAPDGDG